MNSYRLFNLIGGGSDDSCIMRGDELSNALPTQATTYSFDANTNYSRLFSADSCIIRSDELSNALQWETLTFSLDAKTKCIRLLFAAIIAVLIVAFCSSKTVKSLE
ncbi:unnamed protein product [Acanthoscelides obtectus]|uniref:Uncharacterized protein n=1 Tax=Acanthoscelides obtectus TaxID=200917 RepID=A0A9P0PVW4_ACAOB|nr:unnamed protein product [Acanthoscelides obtectus]CAK1675403.1 hypothetical protein AOBTE_LOCUS30204 [Acanthoscelides obtectus]